MKDGCRKPALISDFEKTQILKSRWSIAGHRLFGTPTSDGRRLFGNADFRWWGHCLLFPKMKNIWRASKRRFRWRPMFPSEAQIHGLPWQSSTLKLVCLIFSKTREMDAENQLWSATFVKHKSWNPDDRSRDINFRVIEFRRSYHPRQRFISLFKKKTNVSVIFLQVC